LEKTREKVPSPGKLARLGREILRNFSKPWKRGNKDPVPTSRPRQKESGRAVAAVATCRGIIRASADVQEHGKKVPF